VITLCRSTWRRSMGFRVRSAESQFSWMSWSSLFYPLQICALKWSRSDATCKVRCDNQLWSQTKWL